MENNKNLWVIPTDKPSRLIYNDANDLCYQSNKSYKNDRKWMYRKKFNIYITSDEEIREGDWYLDTVANVLFKNDKIFLNGLGYKKIILTTDTDLIKNGVQDIDDDFLEWFIKNPSCEVVEVQKWFDYESNPNTSYKIIISKEEIKLKDVFNNEKREGLKEFIDKHKQETLEEAAESYAIDKQNENTSKYYIALESFQKGAKWQQERSYSEEDVKNAFLDGWQLRDGDLPFPKAKKKWFNEFKNK